MIAGNISIELLPHHKRRKKIFEPQDGLCNYISISLIIKLIANENFQIIETPILQKVNCSIVSV